MTDIAPPPAPNFDEIAATGDREEYGDWFVGELRLPRDEILRDRGRGNLEIYERLKRDGQVASCWAQRITAAISREWMVEPGGPSPLDQAAADYLRLQLKNAKWDRVSAKMANGLFYGFAVGECLYRRNGTRVDLAAIKVRRARRFRFDRDGMLRLLTVDRAAGEVMPERKFWTFNAGGDDDDDPYGLGLGHHLYWPVWFKRMGVRNWGLYLEKFAMPTPVGELPSGAGAAEKRKALAALKAITGDSAVVMPQGVNWKLAEATRQSGGDYGTFVALMDGEIAKIILTQTMTTDNGSSRAQGQVHADRMKDLVKADNDLLCDSFNEGPARWLTEWNFPGAAVPRVWRDHSEAVDLAARANRDGRIYGMGYQPTQDYIDDTYGQGWVPRPGAGAPVAPDPGADSTGDPTGDFAEPSDIAADLAPQLADAATPGLDQLIDAIKGEIDAADSLEAVRDALLARGLGVPVDEMATAIGEAMVLADLRGRAEQADGG